ncbi:flagellar hook-length control protein FliK, partial [Shewanella sp. SP1S1-7]|nr:flagellar hook-length control protein FliK [Shewanella sp. SP2S1-2]MDT3319320.1 flagellar hook-length control protein FliK [Shewanella sp. SP1S2-4]MDT3334983.1 flagellar hook-length control protein FliK [Shewanella sp. SP1S1-7]
KTTDAMPVKVTMSTILSTRDSSQVLATPSVLSHSSPSQAIQPSSSTATFEQITRNSSSLDAGLVKKSADTSHQDPKTNNNQIIQNPKRLAPTPTLANVITSTNIGAQSAEAVEVVPTVSQKNILGLNTQKNDLHGNDTKTDNPMKVADVLQKAFNKAGALPIELSRSNNSSNLASELLKHLPHIGLPPLSQLNDLDELKANILGLTSLNLATPLSNQASMFMNASAITSLFQLLLGFKANNSSNSMSKKLADYLEQLQAKVGFSTKQLGQLSKAGGLDSMGKLASNLHLYQQASNENAGNLVWFFALPYGINQRHEQLEGKFEQEVDSDDPEKKAGWRLQLKFNLAQGPLLIAAQQHNQQLDIQFKGNSQMLLNKVNNFLTPLSQKLSQLGFTPGEITTQIAQVPATLLPGDHFLVKTKA